MWLPSGVSWKRLATAWTCRSSLRRILWTPRYVTAHTRWALPSVECLPPVAVEHALQGVWWL